MRHHSLVANARILRYPGDPLERAGRTDVDGRVLSARDDSEPGAFLVLFTLSCGGLVAATKKLALRLHYLGRMVLNVIGTVAAVIAAGAALSALA